MKKISLRWRITLMSHDHTRGHMRVDEGRRYAAPERRRSRNWGMYVLGFYRRIQRREKFRMTAEDISPASRKAVCREELAMETKIAVSACTTG